jgi:hypothetical protein
MEKKFRPTSKLWAYGFELKNVAPVERCSYYTAFEEIFLRGNPKNEAEI